MVQGLTGPRVQGSGFGVNRTARPRGGCGGDSNDPLATHSTRPPGPACPDSSGREHVLHARPQAPQLPACLFLVSRGGPEQHRQRRLQQALARHDAPACPSGGVHAPVYACMLAASIRATDMFVQLPTGSWPPLCVHVVQYVSRQTASACFQL